MATAGQRGRCRESCKGVEAVIDGGWRGILSFCTSTRLSSVGRICPGHKSHFHLLMSSSLNTASFTFSVSLSRTQAHAHTGFTRVYLEKLDCVAVWGRSTAPLLKYGVRLSFLTEWVIFLNSFNLPCSYRLPHLPPSPSLLSFPHPASERHQVTIATARLWETEIRSLWTMGSRNWRTWFFFFFFLWTQEAGTLNRKAWTP